MIINWIRENNTITGVPQKNYLIIEEYSIEVEPEVLWTDCKDLIRFPITNEEMLIHIYNSLQKELEEKGLLF